MNCTEVDFETIAYELHAVFAFTATTLAMLMFTM